MQQSKMFYYYRYAPHRMVRRYLGRKVYDWADAKYGVEARGPVNGWIVNNDGTGGVSKFTPKQKEMLEQHRKWMRIKNKVQNKI